MNKVNVEDLRRNGGDVAEETDEYNEEGDERSGVAPHGRRGSPMW